MTDRIEQFFEAYWSPGFKWKLLPGTLTTDDYKKVEAKFNAKFPDNFIEWHKRYFFEDGDCSIIRLPPSLSTKPLAQLIDKLDWVIPEQLIPLGLIPFADEGNDAGPLVFDTRNTSYKKDFPIRVYDHEYGGDLDGLSEIIFSSFDKLLECLTHFLIETTTKESFDVIPDFYIIDPGGAGSTGKLYWEGWTEMLKANFEQFGHRRKSR